MSEALAAQVNDSGVNPVTQEIPEEAPSFKVFAGNLAYSTTDDGLKAFFEPVKSDIISAQVILRGTRSAGYGFVALSSQEAAEKAVQLLDKQELDGRHVIVEIAKPSDQKDKDKKERKAKRRPGRRGGKAVPGEVSEAEANGQPAKADEAEAAAPATATDEAAKPKKKKKKGPRKPRSKQGDAPNGTTPPLAGEEGGTADATATTTSDAAPKKARVRKPRAPRPRRPAGEDPAGEPSKTTLFVANLGFSVDDARLTSLFTEAGISVTSAHVVLRRWGRPRKSKGYGFVDVGSEEEQKKAITALEGKEVDGRNITVKVAVNTPHDEESFAEAKPLTETDAPAPA